MHALLDRLVIAAAIVAALVMTYTVIVFAQGAASQPAVTDVSLFTWLASNPAWRVLVFVVVCMVVTRALDAGLKEKIPKWALPLVSTMVGIAGQMSVALVSGSSWQMAIAFGVASGLAGSGFYSAGGKALPKMKASVGK